MGISFVEESQKMSDNEIISEILKGRYEYLHVLIERYMPLIKKTAKSFEGYGAYNDDLIAEGVLAVFSAVKSFDESKASFFTFVSLCIKRSMLSEIKSATSPKKIPENMLMPIDDVRVEASETPEEAYINKENLNSLKTTIFAELSDLEYKVLSLFLDGNTYADISDKLGISLKSVDNSLNRIRNKLKKNRF